MARKKGRDAPAPLWLPLVIELPPFSQRWDQYRLTEADRTALLGAIVSDPEAWPVVEGAGGARKARFSTLELDRGASGGYRVFYAVYRNLGKILLITIYPKNVQANLSQAGRNLVAALLREIEDEWERLDREERAKTSRGSR